MGNKVEVEFEPGNLVETAFQGVLREIFATRPAPDEELLAKKLFYAGAYLFVEVYAHITAEKVTRPVGHALIMRMTEETIAFFEGEGADADEAEVSG